MSTFSLWEYQINPSLNFLMYKIKVSQSTVFLIEKIIPAELTPCFSLLIFKSTGEQIHTWKLGLEIAVLSLMICVVILCQCSDPGLLYLLYKQRQKGTWAKCLKVSRPTQGFYLNYLYPGPQTWGKCSKVPSSAVLSLVYLVVVVIYKASLVWGNAKTLMGNVKCSFACWTNIDCFGNSL